MLAIGITPSVIQKGEHQNITDRLSALCSDTHPCFPEFTAGRMVHFVYIINYELSIYSSDNRNCDLMLFDDGNHGFTFGAKIGVSLVIAIGVNYGDLLFICAVIRVNYSTVANRTFANGRFSVFQLVLLYILILWSGAVWQGFTVTVSVDWYCFEMKMNTFTGASQIHFIFLFTASMSKIASTSNDLAPSIHLRHYSGAQSLGAFVCKNKAITFFETDSAVRRFAFKSG